MALRAFPPEGGRLQRPGKAGSAVALVFGARRFHGAVVELVAAGVTAPELEPKPQPQPVGAELVEARARLMMGSEVNPAENMSQIGLQRLSINR